MLKTIVVLMMALSLNAPNFNQDGAIWNGAQKTHLTCYYSAPTAHTYSGETVYIGGCASNKENLGKYAWVFTEDKELIGIFKCNDIGGHYQLRNGTAIDIWQPTLDDCWKFIRENGDYGYVVFTE